MIQKCMYIVYIYVYIYIFNIITQIRTTVSNYKSQIINRLLVGVENFE